MVPNNADGSSIVVSATNASGLTTSETFAVQTPAPSPPMVTNQTGTQCCGAGEVNFTLAADTFTDPSGGTLAYAATLPDGTKALAINVTAINEHSLSSSETFDRRQVSSARRSPG